MSVDRPDWITYGLEIARTVSLRGECTRRQVGAVLMLSDNSIVVTGYNGAPAGIPSCLDGACPRGTLTHEQLAADSDYSSGVGTCIALHAEWNVLIRASWEQMKDSTLFVTCEPCHLCWNLIKGTPIMEVYWRRSDGLIDSWNRHTWYNQEFGMTGYTKPIDPQIYVDNELNRIHDGQ